jgi:hypothetical protein
MVDADLVGVSQTRCQAQPAVTRRGWRDDVLCASNANTTVSFRGADVAVCRIHEKAYARWGVDAEGNAALLWGWPGDVALDPEA